VTTPGRFRDLNGRDAYEILGVSPTSSRQEISRARRERQRTAHPDSGGGDDTSKLLNAAASILLDDVLRSEYDRWRQAPEPAAEPAPEPSLWDDSAPGFVAPTPPTPPEAARNSPYRGTGPPPTPGPAPGPGPGMSPMYGSPQVMPHLGQPPPQYYNAPTAPRSRAGLIALIVGLSLGGLCFLSCLVSLATR
jgi:curved DNA-binding protein CbpA